MLYQFHLRFLSTDYLFLMYVDLLNLLPIFLPWFLHLKLPLIQVTAFQKFVEFIQSSQAFIETHLVLFFVTKIWSIYL